MMNIQIQTRNGSLMNSTYAKIAEKVEKLGRFNFRIENVEVVIDLDRASTPRVEIFVMTEYKRLFRSEYMSDDLFGCVDLATEKVAQQLRRFKDKRSDNRIRGAVPV